MTKLTTKQLAEVIEKVKETIEKVDEMQEALGKYMMSPVVLKEKSDGIISVYTAILAEKLTSDLPQIATALIQLQEEVEGLREGKFKSKWKQNRMIDDIINHLRKELSEARAEVKRLRGALEAAKGWMQPVLEGITGGLGEEQKFDEHVVGKEINEALANTPNNDD